MIKDQAELQKLLKLCRKQGVLEISLQGITIKFGDLPQKKSGEDADSDDDIPTDELTPEQMLFYSAPPVGDQ